jgi:hypothetical protein
MKKKLMVTCSLFLMSCFTCSLSAEEGRISVEVAPHSSYRQYNALPSTRKIEADDMNAYRAEEALSSLNLTNIIDVRFDGVLSLVSGNTITIKNLRVLSALNNS